MSAAKLVVIVVLLSPCAPVGRQAVAAQQQAQAETRPATTIEEFAGPGALTYRSAGVVLPKVLLRPDPKYTPAAMRAKVQGIVEIFAIVGLDGHVERSQIAQTLHPDLDAEALRTLAQWRFEPARLDLQPVRIAVTVRMEFRLHR